MVTSQCTVSPRRRPKLSSHGSIIIHRLLAVDERRYIISFCFFLSVFYLFGYIFPAVVKLWSQHLWNVCHFLFSLIYLSFSLLFSFFCLLPSLSFFLRLFLSHSLSLSLSLDIYIHFNPETLLQAVNIWFQNNSLLTGAGRAQVHYLFLLLFICLLPIWLHFPCCC